MIKKTEKLVLQALEQNEEARKDDFILYREVLKILKIDTTYPVGILLANAKFINLPPFATVTRCRRHIQELRPDLKDSKTAIKREEAEEVYKEYNLSGL